MTIEWLLFGLGLMLIFSGMPIVLAIGFCSLLLLTFVVGMPVIMIPQDTISAIDTFLLLAVPMYILTGSLMGETGVTGTLVRFAQSLVGWIRGGLAQVNVITNVFMAGISGSGLADAAAIGSALIPVMKRAGYGAAFSAALTGSASCIGPIIPPSIIMVVIGGLTSISIGKMFLGGIGPGLLLSFLFGVVCYTVSRRRNYRKENRFDAMETMRSFFVALPSLGLPVIIVGGILSGVFTPTESGGVAAVYVIVLGLTTRKLTWRTFYRVVVETGVVTGCIMFIIGISAVFGSILVAEDAGEAIVRALAPLAKDPRLLMFAIVAVLLALGCLMDVLVILILTIPVLMPVVNSAQIDPVYFGVIATVALTTGLVTPPFGLTMFLMCQMAGVTIEEFTREALPFIAALIGSIVLLILFPQIILWLPRMLMAS